MKFYWVSNTNNVAILFEIEYSKLFKNLLTNLYFPLPFFYQMVDYFVWIKSMRKIFIVAATCGFVFRTMCKTAFCFEIYLSFSLSCSRFWPSVSEVATVKFAFLLGHFCQKNSRSAVYLRAAPISQYGYKY